MTPAAAPVVVLVTGSRLWGDAPAIHDRLDRVLAEGRAMAVVHGDGPRGADRIARRWAEAHPVVEHRRVPARWEDYPAAERWRAGHDRNGEMLAWVLARAAEGAEARVLAFKECFDWSLRRGGTENMVLQCMKAGVRGVVIGTPRPSPGGGRGGRATVSPGPGTSSR